jgi:hypothetical protein
MPIIAQNQFSQMYIDKNRSNIFITSTEIIGHVIEMTAKTE